MTKRPNRLIHEKSPYLQQHAHNPVDWYPWGEEAFHEAQRRDTPVFLSIGYSTCHWCHVMERESFEDDETAKALNESFVCVKVDREERPDIDATYMSVCQMLTGGGGWPLTLILTPEKEPFWAGTYLPRTSRSGMLGLRDLIPRITQLWRSDRSNLVSEAATIVEALSHTATATEPTNLNADTLNEAYTQLSSAYDDLNHGFGGAPKFPSPHNHLFLLRYWRRTKTRQAVDMVAETLNSMARGGIHDQLGGGFHRYSTDSTWLIPHFEKMLYDQATLLLAYTEAYQATRDPRHAATARDIADYSLKNLTSTEGAFYSAEDADSEGVEGRYYTWTMNELEEHLGEVMAGIAARIYGVTEAGNCAEGSNTNVLHLAAEDEDLTKEYGLDPKSLQKMKQEIRVRLLLARNRRVKPLLDDKVLTDWNGLMIAALAKAGAALGEGSYIEAAGKAMNFNTTKMNHRGLLHRYRRGEAAIPAFLDDYAYLTWGLIELYEATFDAGHLEKAKEMAEEAVKLFWNPDLGAFAVSRSSEGTLPRITETHDGAKPSGNSVMAMNLLRLGGIWPELRATAEDLLRASSPLTEANPVGYTYLLCALDYNLGPSYEVVVAGTQNPKDTRTILDELHRSFTPNKLLMLKTPGLDSLLEYTKKMGDTGGIPSIYICRDRVCGQPVTNLGEALKTLTGD